MRPRLALIAVVAPLALATLACNPSLVKKGDPLYSLVSKTYYLARPLSGPRWRHPNIFGSRPMLMSGVKVTVTSIDRAPPLYRVTFTGPDKCKPDCVTHWRAENDADFKTLFNDVFMTKSPTAGLEPQLASIIEHHQVANTMTTHEVRLSIGDPSHIDEKDGKTIWTYELRACDTSGRLLERPRLELTFEKGKVESYKELSEKTWHVTDEPASHMSSLCEGIKQLNADTVPLRPAKDAEKSAATLPEKPSLNDAPAKSATAAPAPAKKEAPAAGGKPAPAGAKKDAP